MEHAVGEVMGYISYFTLGILFFFVIWGVAEKITREIFQENNIGWLLGLFLATYGFWYPFVPFLRIPYLIFLAAVSVVGTALSRFGIVSKWSIWGNKTALAGIVISLLVFDSLQYVLPALLIPSRYWVLGKLVSWGLLIYGVASIEMIETVIENSGLPRSQFTIIAFILACVVFLPIEFPLIYGLMSLSAVLGTLISWVSTRRYG